MPLEGLAARPGTATEVEDSLWRSPLELTALQQAETYFLFQCGVPIIAMGNAVECFTNLAGVWQGITPVIMGESPGPIVPPALSVANHDTAGCYLTACCRGTLQTPAPLWARLLSDLARRPPMPRLTIRPDLRSAYGRCLDALLPRHCVLCGLPGGPCNLCADCGADLPRPGEVCAACALPAGSGATTLCGQCLRKPPAWERVEAALAYRFPVDRLVCRFKFGRDFACGYMLGCEMVDAIRAAGMPKPDALVPVPLHRLRHVSRTFNQAHLLARQVGRALGLPVHGSLLRRVRRTRAQTGLDATDRKRNTRGAFRCTRQAGRVLAGCHVALVDDVMTTGATLFECTLTLRRAGVARVSLWVAARAPAH